MSNNRRETIFALSSGRPPAAIAIVRVSGPGARAAIMALAGRVPEPRQATLLRLRWPSGGSGGLGSDSAFEPIDDALVLWFPGPRSETGEDMAEFQLHGGYAVVAAVLSGLGTVEGLRPAGPGEFSRRAFENGKLDLTRVEGLADLIGAETEAQRRQAYHQLKGLLGDRAERWRQRLTEALALVEASIDFPDEDIISEKVIQPALIIAKELEREIRDLLADAHRGERLREGLTVAVAGPVNVGKSSIVNRLAKRSAAIVSPHAGTTRDIIEVHLDLGGFPVTILDTAGMRDTADPVEEEGVRRARARAEASDLVLWVTDASLGALSPPPADGMKPDGPPVWILLNKSDLVEAKTPAGASDGDTVAGTRLSMAEPFALPFPLVGEGWGGGSCPRGTQVPHLPTPIPNPSPAEPRYGEGSVTQQSDRTRQQPTSVGGGEQFATSSSRDLAAIGDTARSGSMKCYRISALTGASFDDLVGGLADYARRFFSGGGDSALVTRQRHRTALLDCAEALKRTCAEDGTGREEIVAEELRLAARALGQLIGRVDVENVLDVIFRDFCIGK
jgi:tRNA modification GTPase